jgi:glycosyltransferase involved in cell wall biosynthesis
MTQRRPLVTIVTPSFNQAATLAETLASVAAQDYPAIEHLVVDGGSTDGSVELLKSAKGIRWLSEKDRGQSDAINKGMRMARGEVVAFLNSDDLLLPGAVSAVVAHLEAHPEVDLVYGDGIVIDAQGNTLWEWLSRPEDWRLLADYFFLWNDFTNYVMQQATFWRRSLHDRIGFFDESFHYAMDVEFWLRTGASGARLDHLPVMLAKFRMAPGTKSLSSPTIFWEDMLELFRRYNRAGMGRFTEQYLFEEMKKCGVGLDEARSRFRAVAERRWKGISDAAALRALADERAPGALVRLADDAWNEGDAGRARSLLREALRLRRGSLAHPRAVVLLAKLATGPLEPRARKAWFRGIERWRNWRYQYRYVEKRRRERRPG